MDNTADFIAIMQRLSLSNQKQAEGLVFALQTINRHKSPQQPITEQTKPKSKPL